MKDVINITQPQYEEVASRVEELKNAPAPSFPAPELKSRTKSLLPYERRLRSFVDS
jgi:hypothetical protein